MKIYYFSLSLAVASNVFYHLCQKSISAEVNPFSSLIITYGTALILSLGLFFALPSDVGFFASISGMNWASVALGFTIIGLELGFLLAYRAGWNVSVAAVIANSLVAIILIPIGLVLYKEHISFINLLGIGLSIVGFLLINN